MSFINNLEEDADKDKDMDKDFGLHEKLSDQDYNMAIDIANEQLKLRDAYNEEKNLSKDVLTVRDQNFCVVSWVGPSLTAKTTIYGFRIMGVFATLSEAKEHAILVSKVISKYDVGIMEMYLWCFSYPDPSDAVYNIYGELDDKKTQNKIDSNLNKIIVDHKVKLEKDKQLFLMRKNKLKFSKQVRESENIPSNEVLLGAPTEEQEKIHNEEMSKWIDLGNEGGFDVKPPLPTPQTDKPLILLDHDVPLKIPEQEWAVVSFVGCSGKNNRVPMSIKGVFATEKEATDQIKSILDIESAFDLIPVPLYKWCHCDPDLSKIAKTYADEKLNEMFKAEKDQHAKTLAHHREREEFNLEKTIKDTSDEEANEEVSATELLQFMERPENTASEEDIRHVSLD